MGTGCCTAISYREGWKEGVGSPRIGRMRQARSKIPATLQALRQPVAQNLLVQLGIR